MPAYCVQLHCHCIVCVLQTKADVCCYLFRCILILKEYFNFLGDTLISVLVERYMRRSVPLSYLLGKYVATTSSQLALLSIKTGNR